MASERIPVAHEVLTWARRTSGLDAETAARRLGTSEANLAKLEAGDVQPTIRQLRLAAHAYGRPLAVLLLPEPPTDFQPLADFRRTDGRGGAGVWSPALVSEYRRALSQREVLLEIADLGPARDTAQVPNLADRPDPEKGGARLRTELGLARVPAGYWSRPYEALRAVISAVEALDVVVIHTRGVEPSEAEGFSVAELPYPVIALNGKDFPRRRLFTLLHEMAHIGMRAGGLCDLHESRRHRSPDDEIEHYCNAVAAAALMPPDAFRDTARSVQVDMDGIGALSAQFGASSEAALLRMVSLGLTTWDQYWDILPALHDQYDTARAQQAQQQREREGGPSYYLVKARDLGHGYVAEVLDAYRSRVISSLDVADYLDVRYDQLPNLEKVVAG